MAPVLQVRSMGSPEMKLTIAFASILVVSAAAHAQEGNPTQRLERPSDGSAPLYRVNVVARTTQADNYGHRSDQTRIDFAGTLIQPDAKGEARISGNRGAVEVKAKFKKLPPPQRFSGEPLVLSDPRPLLDSITKLEGSESEVPNPRRQGEQVQ